MQFLRFTFVMGLLFDIPRAVPVSKAPVYERGLIDGVHALDDLLLFDAPAFPDPQKPGEILTDVQTYAFSRVVTLANVIPSEVQLVVKALSGLGIDAAQRVTDLQERLKLFLALGLAGKSEQLNVPGCSASPKTGPTGLLPDLGLSDSMLSLGRCGSTKQATASIKLDMLDNRKISSTIYFSPNSGFGVISDIDDTIKISNVLNKAELAKATLLDKPMPVTGMPELYASLAKSLPDPQFIYITGSPFQLYPFLNGFVKSSFAASAGPIWTRNLTLTNPSDIVNFLAGDSKTIEYKVSQIDRLHSMYPNKKWLAIGDSTEKDPEIYAQVFKKYPGFISCIWIRKVDGAANEQSRFDTAFKDLPKEKIKVFTDADISSLSSIRIADGECIAQVDEMNE